jgi:formamidopyrimidine-DNA glycosylase
MPELPEVEHAARMLRGFLEGRVILHAEASEARVFRGGDRRAFASALCGRKLSRLSRRGKYLLLAFDGGVSVLSHLGMTGKWIRRERARGARPPHSRARLALDDGSVVHYCDPRMFGRIAVHRGKDLDRLPEIRALGPDPLEDGIDPRALVEALARTSRPVKVALMDQRVIAGIGNIQATEALFRARVAPTRPARAITPREAARLAEAIRASVDFTLEATGPGEITYLSEGARVANPFLVYGREGAPCPRCGRPIDTISLGGRASAHCASCQR